MRISYWSSDVCSSDLPCGFPGLQNQWLANSGRWVRFPSTSANGASTSAMRPGRRTHASSRGGSGMSKVREVVVPGARLSVEIRGEGSPALVMLHGLASDRRSWDRVVAELGLQDRKSN